MWAASRWSSQSRLHYLLYVSEADGGLDTAAIQEIKRQAMTFNWRAGITGFLLHQDGCFLQMLEGDPDRIEALMERIRRDPRHHNVRVLTSGPAARRVFPDWTMGFRELDDIAVRLGIAASGGGLAQIAADPVLAYAYITAFSCSGDN